MQKERINKQLKKIIRNAFHHLKKDEVMCYLIKNLESKLDWTNRYSDDYALSISNLIIEQQISFKAAITIKKRFQRVVENLDYNQIINLKNEEIQKIGLSFRKVEYIKNVFTFFIDNEKEFILFDEEKMQQELISIKGIGKWTIEMFLMFELGKPDIFSKGDIALINSVKKNYKMDGLDKSKLDSLIKSWSPYNSTASLLLWKSVEEKVFFN